MIQRYPDPHEVTREHADRLSDEYDYPLDLLCLELLTLNRMRYLEERPKTIGAATVREQGLTANQKDAVETIAERLDSEVE